MSSGYSQGNERFASLSEALSVQEFVAEREGDLFTGGYGVLLVSLLLYTCTM